MLIEKEGMPLSIFQFEKIAGAKWTPTLDFDQFKTFSSIAKQTLKLHKKGVLTQEQLWLGCYFQKEILSGSDPDVAIRWIDETLGWGIFALRDFKKMEFIAEYAGKVRKRKKTDSKNSYCFEYIIAPGAPSPYTIDALEQGGIGRYINHSTTPNLNSSLATFNGLSHVIFYTKEPVAKGAQLCYDYGPDYWAKRTAPILL